MKFEEFMVNYRCHVCNYIYDEEKEHEAKVES